VSYYALLALARMAGARRGARLAIRWTAWITESVKWVRLPDEDRSAKRTVVDCRICEHRITVYRPLFGGARPKETEAAINVHAAAHLSESGIELSADHYDAWCIVIRLAEQGCKDFDKALAFAQRRSSERAKVIADALLERPDVQAWFASRTKKRARRTA
jgi:hypothetical protein